jgi:F0F1-type ATP synthase gamma subunit
VASSVLYVGLFGDKGFCGAINSSIVRSVRDNTNKFKAEGGTTETAKIMIMGERGRGGLERHFKNRFTVSVTDYDKVRSFKQCAELADLVLGHRPVAIAASRKRSFSTRSSSP